MTERQRDENGRFIKSSQYSSGVMPLYIKVPASIMALIRLKAKESTISMTAFICQAIDYYCLNRPNKESVPLEKKAPNKFKF